MCNVFSSTISWALIASYYSALPFNRDGLMTANSPWSGYYRVESPIWVTAHTTQFTSPGWMYLQKNQGVELLSAGGSIVSLVSPDSKDLTIILETMAHIQKLYVWYSKLGYAQQPSTLFKNLGSFPVVNAEVQIELGVDEVYTLTTLTVGEKGTYPDPPAPTSFPLPYQETFDEYMESAEPYYFAQQTGSYEIVTAVQTSHGKVLRQVVLEPPVLWCSAEMVHASINIIGNSNWSDLYVEVDAMIGQVNASDSVFVAARVDNLGCGSFAAVGVFFFLFPEKKTYEVAGDLARTQPISSGSANANAGWNNLALLVEGNTAVGILNEEKLFGVMLPEKTSKVGFAALGTGFFGIADFDNLKIYDTVWKGGRKSF